MDTLLKILQIIHNLIWIVIGAAILIVGFLIFSQGPEKLISGMVGSVIQRQDFGKPNPGPGQDPGSGSNLVSPQGNQSGEQPGNQQENNSQKMSPSQQNCIKKATGSERYSQFEKGSSPTQEEINKMTPCFKQ